MADGKGPEQIDKREVLVIALCLALFVLLANGFFPSAFFDDSFITFRYARNLSRGAGLSWNAAEGPLEGFTGIAWVVLLGSGSRWTGLDVPVIAVRLGVGCGLLCLVATWLCARRLLPSSAPWWARVLPVAQLALTPEFVRHARSGMETLLTAAVLVLTLLFWVSSPVVLGRARTWLLGGVLAAMASLARPDAVLFGLALGGACAFQLGGVRGARGAWGGLFGAFALTLLMFWCVRRAYFGEWLPLPAYLKMRPGALLQSGPLNFVLGHWLGYLGLVAPGLALFALAAARHEMIELRLRAALLAAGVYAAYFLTVLPIMSLAFRYLIPTLPVLCIGAAWGLCGLLSGPLRSNGRLWVALATAALLFQGLGRFPVLKRDTASWANAHEPYAELGRRIRGLTGVTVAVSEVGELGWYSDAAVVDLAGLNDRFIAKHRFASLNFPREFADYIQERHPDLYVEPPREYAYAAMARQRPAFARGYRRLSFRGLDVFVRLSGPGTDAMLRILTEP